jgi:hypothetical protein
MMVFSIAYARRSIMTTKYWLTIVEIDTGKCVYENGFYTREGIEDELEDWHPEDYCYSIKELEAAE